MRMYHPIFLDRNATNKENKMIAIVCKDIYNYAEISILRDFESEYWDVYESSEYVCLVVHEYKPVYTG